MPPVFFRQHSRLCIGVTDLVVAVDPDLACIQLRQQKLQYWCLSLCKGQSQMSSVMISDESCDADFKMLQW